ncbi:hypothetical protein QTO34_011756 [Cnephaeus nilssonii]|uniref:Death effector domain-containing protein n=2 Tax=Boreoeutheria TaxID=1437010 RepID=A0AA40LDM1_CNENI|nr:hypothetical protein QTO34_011756 [Eptesicus nilssonii]
MAGLKRRASQVWPEERGEQEHGLYSLHRMFDIVGTHLTHRDVRVLSFLFVDVIDDHERGLIRNGRDFLLALERQGRCDETNFRQVLQLLRIITRHDLLPYVTLKRRRAVCPDLVDKYLEETSIRYVTPRALSDPEPRPPQTPKTGPQMCSKRPARGRATLGSQRKRRKSVTPDPKEKQTCGEKFKGPRGTLGSARLPLVLLQSEVCVVALGEDSSVLVAEQCQLFVANTRSEGRVMTSILQEEPHHSIMVACEKDCLLTRKYLPEKRCYLRDIRLRVRAEYCQHETALQGNVFSNKQDPLERQFERFNQANTILKSRDLGSIICDIKFSELTYLDAFWRDYINGSLLEALKGVFITDSLKQAVGHEAIKLLVNVDEEDYELGRQKLLRNLMLQALP